MFGWSEWPRDVLLMVLKNVHSFSDMDLNTVLNICIISVMTVSVHLIFFVSYSHELKSMWFLTTLLYLVEECRCSQTFNRAFHSVWVIFIKQKSIFIAKTAFVQDFSWFPICINPDFRGDTIQLKFICIALFTIQIIAKQSNRKCHVSTLYLGVGY